MTEMQGPPITRLNNDLLLLIFATNADMFTNNNALKSTRLSSQVCRDWRDTILERPSLWGRLIDLDVLTQRKDEWRKEILRRSRQSSLSIRSVRALLYASGREIPPWQDFFFLLLDNEWGRIERLTVSIGSHISIPPDILCSPAPQLRVFELYSSPHIQIPQDQPLFDNNAPLLHTFRSRDLAFNPSSSWLRNLRFVEIGPNFPISFVLDMLKTPFLETLIYAGSYSDDAHDRRMLDLSSLTLGPNIKRLGIGAHYDSCMGFIGCIIPKNDYNLYIATSRVDSHTSLDSLSLYTTRHFRVHAPTHMSLDLCDQFYFTSSNANGTRFSLRIPCSNTPGNNLPLKILSILHIPVCSLVTELDLSVHHSLQDEAKLPIATFLRLVPHAKVLHVSAFTCACLVDVQKHSSDIFLPDLNTLHVGAVSEDVLEFIHMRREAGHPISVLNLTKCEKPGVLMIPLENLQRFTGLQIIWN